MSSVRGLVWVLGDWQVVVAVAGRKLAVRDPAGTWRSGTYPTYAKADWEAVRRTDLYAAQGYELALGPAVFTTPASLERLTMDALHVAMLERLAVDARNARNAIIPTGPSGL